MLHQVVVGIDVSKDRLDVCLLPGGELFVVSRNAASLSDLTERLKGLSVGVIAIEATGGAGPWGILSARSAGRISDRGRQSWYPPTRSYGAVKTSLRSTSIELLQ